MPGSETGAVPLLRLKRRGNWRGLVPVALLVLAGFVATACDVSVGGFGNMAGQATDEWTRTYPLNPGGTVRIANINGRVEIEGVEGSTVDVRAERIARAATETGAREMLQRIVIKEDARPERVSVETERMSGLIIGVSTEVRYHVRAPKTAAIEVSNTNGLITVSNLAGKVVAHTTNGGVAGKGLSGGVDARATNGGVNVELASLGSDAVVVDTTNGGVTLTLPETSKADITASCTNGGISVSGGKIEVSEQTRRRFAGRMNGGGTSVDLHTTNGGVRVQTASGT